MPVLDVRSTDDKFVMAIDLNNGAVDMNHLRQLLRDNGASEVNEKEMTQK